MGDSYRWGDGKIIGTGLFRRERLRTELLVREGVGVELIGHDVEGG